MSHCRRRACVSTGLCVVCAMRPAYSSIGPLDCSLPQNTMQYDADFQLASLPPPTQRTVRRLLVCTLHWSHRSRRTLLLEEIPSIRANQPNGGQLRRQKCKPIANNGLFLSPLLLLFRLLCSLAVGAGSCATKEQEEENHNSNSMREKSGPSSTSARPPPPPPPAAMAATAAKRTNQRRKMTSVSSKFNSIFSKLPLRFGSVRLGLARLGWRR